jgi:hypothetical protein
VRVAGVPVAVWPDEPGCRPRVLWSAEPPVSGGAGAEAPFFFKIIAGDAFGAPFFRGLVAAYAAYAAALASEGARTGDAPPPALLPAELLFGAAEVCVRMAWAPGRDAAPTDLEPGGAAVAPVAAALVWLARRGLLYVDLREPNVRVSGGEGGTGGGSGGSAGGGSTGGGVALVDYDEMVVPRHLRRPTSTCARSSPTAPSLRRARASRARGPPSSPPCALCGGSRVLHEVANRVACVSTWCRLDESVLETVREQSTVGSLAARDIADARESIGDLEGKITLAAGGLSGPPPYLLVVPREATGNQGGPPNPSNVPRSFCNPSASIAARAPALPRSKSADPPSFNVFSADTSSSSNTSSPHPRTKRTSALL